MGGGDLDDDGNHFISTRSPTTSSPSLSTEPPSDLLVFGLILLPPLVFALINPGIFFRALDTAGTFGISVLFGIIPACMAWVQRYGPVGESPSTSRGTPELVAGGRATLALMIGVALLLVLDFFVPLSTFLT